MEFKNYCKQQHEKQDHEFKKTYDNEIENYYLANDIAECQFVNCIVIICFCLGFIALIDYEYCLYYKNLETNNFNNTDKLLNVSLLNNNSIFNKNNSI